MVAGRHKMNADQILRTIDSLDNDALVDRLRNIWRDNTIERQLFSQALFNRVILQPTAFESDTVKKAALIVAKELTGKEYEFVKRDIRTGEIIA